MCCYDRCGRVKNVNDRYGHAIGDVLLADIAVILKKYTRSKDIVIRWGGDEFVIIFAEISLKNALEVMEKIRYKVEGTFFTISLNYKEQEQDLKDPLTKADQALYKTKERKNVIVMVKGL